MKKVITEMGEGRFPVMVMLVDSTNTCVTVGVFRDPKSASEWADKVESDPRMRDVLQHLTDGFKKEADKVLNQIAKDNLDHFEKEGRNAIFRN